MLKPKYTDTLTDAPREANERARLKEISLKWAKIANERAKEESALPGTAAIKKDAGAKRSGAEFVPSRKPPIFFQ